VSIVTAEWQLQIFFHGGTRPAPREKAIAFFGENRCNDSFVLACMPLGGAGESFEIGRAVAGLLTEEKKNGRSK
jgi:hypothetical protein